MVPADGAADVLEPDELDEPEPPESEELKNDRELWYPLPDPLEPPAPLRHAGEAGSSGAPPSARRHVSLGIIE